MKKIIFTLSCLLTTITLNAQSTVWFITRDQFMEKGVLTINGENEVSFLTPTNRCPSRLVTNRYYPAYMKITIDEEGPTVFRTDMVYAIPNETTKKQYVGEITLNLSTGSVNYIYLTNKGLDNIKLLEVSEKKAKKLMGKKNCVALPDFVVKY